MTVSRSVHDAEECQAAMEALLLVAEHDGPTMFARSKGISRKRPQHRAEKQTEPTNSFDDQGWEHDTCSKSLKLHSDRSR